MDDNASTQTKPSTERRFSSDEVADIIRLSLQDESRRHSGNSVDYEELLIIAKDVGVDGEQIDRAVRLLEEEQLTRDKERALWQRFKSHALLFAAINLLLITINLISGADTFWAMYVVFGWGLFLLGHYAGLRYAPQFVEMATQRTRDLMDNKLQVMADMDDGVLFSTSDSMGMTETTGMLSREDDKLILEYQTVDAVLGVLKSGVKVVEIPLDRISSARVEQKLWGADLVLQGKSMRVFGNAPGVSGGQLRVKLKRPSVSAANALVDGIRSVRDSAGTDA